MKVELVHHTHDGDSLIAYMARVSNPNNQTNHATAPKLIKYLINHGHWSPLEMVSLCVKIETTRSIAQQIIRHRSFSFQEFSQRYAEVSNIQIPELRRQDLKNRQNSIDDLDINEVNFFKVQLTQHFQKSMDLYQQMLQAGVAKECARDVLPLSSLSTLYMHGNMRSWYHYIKLRSHESTQLEHRQIALACKDILKDTYPTLHQTLNND